MCLHTCDNGHMTNEEETERAFAACQGVKPDHQDDRVGSRESVMVDGELITGTVYHVRNNGWACVETHTGRMASGPGLCEWMGWN